MYRSPPDASMQTADRLRRALGNPKLFARGCNRAYHRRGGRRSANPRGMDVFDADWDTLVVLDACRYDMFAEQNHLAGTLTPRESRGSATSEWLRANVDGRDLRDTVYVTANPQLARHREDWDVNLHETVDVWRGEGWDDEAGTVRAETMTAVGRRAHETSAHKRVVVHYMQPHYPFVPAATEIGAGHLDALAGGEGADLGENVWNRKFLGDLAISRETLWEYYRDNLDYVLDHVEDLLAAISGKAVVTADHGNYVGERSSPLPIREFGHPRGIYDDPLVRVPWLECPFEERREVVTGTVSDTEPEGDVAEVTDRLRALGYAE